MSSMYWVSGFSSPPSFVVPAARRCLYKSKVCPFPRDVKANGEMHRLCSLHRTRAITNQRRWLRRRRSEGFAGSPVGRRSCSEGSDEDFERLWASVWMPKATERGVLADFSAAPSPSQRLVESSRVYGDQLASPDVGDMKTWSLDLDAHALASSSSWKGLQPPAGELACQRIAGDIP